MTKSYTVLSAIPVHDPGKAPQKNFVRQEYIGDYILLETMDDMSIAEYQLALEDLVCPDSNRKLRFIGRFALAMNKAQVDVLIEHLRTLQWQMFE